MRSELLVASRFAEDHPGEAAAVLEGASFTEAAGLLGELSVSVSAQVLARISPSLAADCLRTMPPQLVAEVLAALPLDITSRLLRRASDETREGWLAGLPTALADALRRKLRFPPGTAGALADPLVLALPADMSVTEAQKQLRRSPERAYYYIYMVDRDHRLVGVLDVRELMLASGKEPLSAVMHGDPVCVSAQSDLSTIVPHQGWRELDALPVVDAAGVFIGIVRHRTMRQLSGAAAEEPVEPVVNTLVNLGELYWAGLSAFLSGMSVKPPPAADMEREASHGA